jgi:hypothetical protein
VTTAITVWADAEVQRITDVACEKDDVELVKLMLRSHDHSHQLAAGAGMQAMHNTITVSKCMFQAVAMRWIPLEVFATALRELIDEAAREGEWNA